MPRAVSCFPDCAPSSRPVLLPTTALPAVFYNTLDGMGGFGTPRDHPKQQLVLFAMESGKYYPAIYTAKDQGFNISAGGAGWGGAGAGARWGCCGGVAHSQ